jgi:chemotaxis protein methyltransferase CheR
VKEKVIIPLSDKNYDQLTKLIYEKSGIALTKEKAYLVEARLEPLLAIHKLKCLNSLAEKADKDAALCKDVVEAMTTNESSFFRDIKPFEYLKNSLIPSLKTHTPKSHYKIWCAACASGQEPYSITMSLLEMPEAERLMFSILATDIDSKMLDIARKGIYTQFEVQRGMPMPLLIKYFKQKHDKWHINQEVQQHVRFESFNLLDSSEALGKFDLLFCRNVLIYFDQETKQAVLERICQRMQPHSVLFLGSTETLIGIDVPLQHAADASCPGVYMLKNDA